MREAWRTIWATVVSVFSAIGNGAEALNSWAIWARKEAEGFEQMAVEERKLRLAEQKRKLAELEAAS